MSGRKRRIKTKRDTARAAAQWRKDEKNRKAMLIADIMKRIDP